MKPFLPSLLFCLSFIPLPASDTSAPSYFPDEDWTTVSPDAEQIDRPRLMAALAYLEAVSAQDGLTEAMLIRRGRVVWEGSRIDSRHHVYSCTKSYASILIGLLIDDGKLSLDTRLADIIPDYQEFYPDLTIRHTLTLTDGYVGDERQPWIPLKPRAAPGETFHYGPFNGLTALARVITKITGKPLADFFQERIGKPIGYNRAFEWQETSVVDGITLNYIEYGLTTNARYMARFGLLLLNNGRWKDQQIVSAHYIKEATHVQAPLDIPMYDPSDWYSSIHGAFGYLFWVNGIRDDGKRIWPNAPEQTYAMVGNRNNVCFIIPEWDIVFVRLGADEIVGPDKYDTFFSLLKESLLDL